MSRRRWTFMVFMAGDNGKLLKGERVFDPMEDAGYRDLGEMEAVGSTEDVAILVQFDTLSDAKQTYRLFVRPASEERQVQAISEQNTGDPASLADFVGWGMQHYPADRYALILWNHGTGWNEEDLYAFARRRGAQAAADVDEVRGAFRRGRRSPQAGARGSKLSSGLFMSSALQVTSLADRKTRGICYDDSSMDFLDNAELQTALRQVRASTGQGLSLLGMDACLMSMLEIAYQVRGEAEYLIGSQEVEPMAGWPYTPILEALTRNPSMTPEALARLIVNEYGKSFPTASRAGLQPVTQSAINLAAIGRVAEAVGGLAGRLRRALEADDLYLADALRRAGNAVLRFDDPDYADLHDLVSLLRSRYRGDDESLMVALDETLGLLGPDAEPAVVVANVATGPAPHERAHGLSIYLPRTGYSGFYDKLDFASFGWGDFLCVLNEVPDERRRPS